MNEIIARLKAKHEQACQDAERETNPRRKQAKLNKAIKLREKLYGKRSN